MSKITIKIFSLFLLSFLSLKGFAQDGDSKTLPQLWDLETCLQYAKENNVQIKTLKLNTQSAEQDKILAKAAVLPDLYGSASQSFNHYNSATNNSTTKLNYSGSYGISSGWTLYQGGYLKTDIKQKDLSVQAANFSVLESENDITLQITQAYINILVDKESIVYNRDLLATSNAQLEQARRQFAAGTVAKKVVAQFEAQYAGDQYNLLASENAERQDKITLRQLLQLPNVENFDVAKPDTIINNNAIPTLASVQQYALQNRPEIKNAELGVRISDLNITKAQSGYKPSLTLGTGIGTSYARDPNYNVFSQFNSNFYQQAGFTLSIPLFTKKQNQTNVAKARIASEQAKLTLENTKTTLSLATESAYLTVQNSTSQFQAAVEQLKYNREVYRIANEELRIGATNVVDFYQQRNLYVQAMQAYIQAKYNATLSAKIYEFYIGVPIKL